jgi:hypothetical protein
MNSRALAGLACALLAASACTSTHPDTDGSPSGRIGGGISILTSTPVGEPGEDLFLTQKPGKGRPFRLGATATYDACTVLPMSAVRQAGIELDTPSGYQVVHTFIERDAPGDPSQAAPNIDGLSRCVWFGVNHQLVALDIYQLPFNDDRDRAIRLENLESHGSKPESVRGMRTFTCHPCGINKDSQEWQVSLFADNYWAVLTLTTAQDVATKLVDGIVANLLPGPTGPSSFAYSGPYDGFPDPCALFTRDDFRRTYGIDDTGRVERWLTAGDQDLEDDNHQLTRYIRANCKRKAIGKTFDDQSAPGLDVEFDVAPAAEQAAVLEGAVCDPKSSAGNVFGPPLTISTKIGDGRVCMPNEGRPNRRLVFRAGRTVVYLANWLYTDAASLNALAEKLTPIAQTIATRLR